MAVKGSIIYEYPKAIGASDSPKIRLSWQRSAFSAERNTSTIVWTYELYLTKATTLTTYYEITFNGLVYVGSFTKQSFKAGWNTLRTATQDIKHNPDGTKTFSYSFIETYDSMKPSASGSDTIDTIFRGATLLTAPKEFTDEKLPTITYSNPAGEDATNLQVGIVNRRTDVIIIPYRDIDKTGSTYTFTLTEAERAEMLNKIVGVGAPVKIILISTVSGVKYSVEINATLLLANYAPTFSPIIEDVNSYTVGLTGNKDTLIKYHSNAKVTFGAQGQKGATIISRTVINGSQTIEIEDRTQDSVVINGVDSNTFYLSAQDSRGNEGKDAATKTLVEYIKLTNTIKSATLEPTGTTTTTAKGRLTFTITGKFFNKSFGNSINAKSNTLEVEYMVEDSKGQSVLNTESGWVKLGVVDPYVDNEDNYTFTYSIDDLDYLKNYKLTVNAIDLLTPVQSSRIVVAAVPLFDWNGENFRHHTDVYIDRGKSLQADVGTSMGISLIGLNEDNELNLGSGLYDMFIGDTNFYGNRMSFNSRQTPVINGYPLADFVIEQGTIDTWFYRKWNSGRVELYGYQNISNLACNTALGGMYRTAVITPPNFPFTVNSPKLVATYESEGYGAFVWATTLTTTAKPFNYYLVRPTSSTGITGKVSFHAQGTWN